MSEPELIWEDPPPSKRGAGKPELLAKREAMKAHPGKWLLYQEVEAPSSLDWLKRKGFEAAMRTIRDSDPKRYRLYARWPEVADRDGTTTEGKADE